MIANSISEISYTEIQLNDDEAKKSGFTLTINDRAMSPDVLSTLLFSCPSIMGENHLQKHEVYLYENDIAISRYTDRYFIVMTDGNSGVFIDVNLSKVNKIVIHSVYGDKKYIFSQSLI